MANAIVWFRDDLRLDDHPALNLAIERGFRVLPLFVWEQDPTDDWAPGAASRWWLHHSLHALSEQLRQLGNQLVVASGDPERILTQLIETCSIEQVFAIRRHQPAAAARDLRITNNSCIPLTLSSGNQLFEPDEILTQDGRPYRVFTPFWKRCQSYLDALRPHAGPQQIPALSTPPPGLPLESLGLLPRHHWADSFSDHWRPGEAGAKENLNTFNQEALSGYQQDRDRPDVVGTSLLSPHLHFGEISVRRVLKLLTANTGYGSSQRVDAQCYIRELGWREFSRHLLHHYPHTSNQPMNDKFSGLPWRENQSHLRAWQEGQTGIPLVDAGMRQLWQTGWMHNRVRMVVASFLCKNLRIHWLEGARWFYDTLVDADLANNTQGWQWSAGCGADAAPYFRIFSPLRQAERFDPEASYITRWIPELAPLPARYRHAPWQAPAAILAQAGLRLGVDYPNPLVDLAQSRKDALLAYEKIR